MLSGHHSSLRKLLAHHVQSQVTHSRDCGVDSMSHGPEQRCGSDSKESSNPLRARGGWVIRVFSSPRTVKNLTPVLSVYPEKTSITDIQATQGQNWASWTARKLSSHHLLVTQTPSSTESCLILLVAILEKSNNIRASETLNSCLKKHIKPKEIHVLQHRWTWRISHSVK